LDFVRQAGAPSRPKGYRAGLRSRGRDPMKLGVQALLGMSFLVAAPVLPQEFEERFEDVFNFEWVFGPANVDITTRAELSLPEGYNYPGRQDTRRMMELLENIPGDEEYFVAPDDMRWFAVFQYDDSGHVKDDERIDADEVLDAIREGNEYANRVRRRNGWSELDIVGWKYPPFYEEGSKRLAWAILAESEGSLVVNYNTRLLGRTGVMSAVLVANPDTLESAVAEFQTVLEGFEY